MTEAQLIKQIKELRQIKPRKEWVVFTKNQIFKENESYEVEPRRVGVSLKEGLRFIFRFKPAFASAIVLAVLVGTFVLARNSLPGELLYPVKKIAENARAVFVSEEGKPKLNLETANRRLEELTKIAETNQVKKLAPAIKEYKASIVEANQNLKKAKEVAKLNKEIVQETQKLEEKKEILTNVYGVAGLENEETSPLKTVAEWLITDLENRSLTEEEQGILTEAKEYLEAEDYSSALEKALEIGQEK